jgi:Ran GTPase-activating protein (RanGAP) involved in mRNA processing and transport
LTELNVADNALRADAAPLLDALSHSTALARLDVSGNAMGDRGTFALAKGT